MGVNFDKICGFVHSVFGENESLANATIKEFGIDPNTRRPTPVAADEATATRAAHLPCPNCGVLVEVESRLSLRR
jgi:hypothetical protein